MGVSHPPASEVTDRFIVVDLCRANQTTHFRRIDGELWVCCGELKDWPIIPRRAGVHILVRDGCKQSTFQLVMDQARCLSLPRGSMGCGLKLVMSNCDAVLPFCIVAMCRSSERLADAYHQSLGGEQGYGVLHVQSRHLVYDIARSPAYLVNCRRETTHKLSCKSFKSPRAFTASFRARSKKLALGHLFAPYGTGSDQHATIASEQQEREARKPVCSEQKAALKAQMSALSKRRWGIL